MKVSEHAQFRPEFPEAYTWGRIDSIKFCNVATTISNYINHDLRSVDRNLVPGLRQALNIIADHAEV